MPVSIQPATLKYKDGNVYKSADNLRGETGPVPAISIGNVSTGAPGTDAAVSITGSHESPVLNFTIPKGDPGEAITVLSPVGNVHILNPCPATYTFGEKSMLDVTVTATSQFHFMFSCPSESPTNLVMHGIIGTSGSIIEAGKTYEVDIWAGIAYIREIEVTLVT